VTTTTEPQYAVHFDGYRWECLPIVRVTAQKVICKWHGTERHLRRDEVPLSLSAETARKVVERLTSSESLLAEDRRKAAARRNERNAKIIEGARV
jgi:hypothetical protein